MPERSAWDRIVVATPAYRVQGVDAMAGRSQGFGVFMQPLCRSLSGACGMNSIGQMGERTFAGGGETVQTPDGQTIKANQKMWDPKADSLDLSQVIPKRVLAARIVELASHATAEAVTRSELRGKVEVKERGEVKDAPK